MRIAAQSLTREAFAPFGDVIETDGSRHFPINEGTTERFHDLAPVDVSDEGGRPLINLFRAQPRSLPLAVRIMERHSLSSQAFVPLSQRPFLVLVAPPGETVRIEDLKAFVAQDGQGVSYRRGVWHHPLIALEVESDFLVIDRGGPGENLDETAFPAGEAELTY